MNGKLLVDEFVTGEISLEKINGAFDLMHAGKGYVQLTTEHDLKKNALNVVMNYVFFCF